jgi:dihydroorotate dehydrogenase (NAD+) catalytic subunit
VDDAIEFILLGAHAVQVGTANYVQPTLATEIVQGLRDYLTAHGFESVDAIRGVVG